MCLSNEALVVFILRMLQLKVLALKAQQATTTALENGTGEQCKLIGKPWSAKPRAIALEGFRMIGPCASRTLARFKQMAHLSRKTRMVEDIRNDRVNLQPEKLCAKRFQ